MEITVHVHVLYYMYFRLSGVTEMEQVVEEEETKLMDPALSLTEEDVGQFVPVGPASGPDVVPRLLQGVRVVKGPDWKWGDQVRSSLSLPFFSFTCTCIFSFFHFISPLFPFSLPSSLPSLPIHHYYIRKKNILTYKKTARYLYYIEGFTQSYNVQDIKI